MSHSLHNDTAQFITKLDDEAKYALLEQLAEELGYDLAEQGEPVDPQTDIIEVVEGAIQAMQTGLGILQQQFATGAELDYTELNLAATTIEHVVGDLSEVHSNLYAVIDSEFDMEDDDEDDEEEFEEDEAN